jgi:trehalose 6-phosphate synthase/phosphatase
VLDSSLHDALTELATRERLLVACDFDGVLAPIVTDPLAARPLPESAAALDALARFPQARVALVSGRQLDELVAVASPPSEAVLVGSHGAQLRRPGQDDGDSRPLSLTGPERELLSQVTAEVEGLRARFPGTALERKPAAAVLHTRSAERGVAAAATAAALDGPASWPGVHVTMGKEVVEMSVLGATKGDALRRLRLESGLPEEGGGVLFLGDDVTDERAFAVLRDEVGDITVKVGPGKTVARHRIAGPREVAELLGSLVDLISAR